ncbi:MAG: RNA polymerase sporulation sigma factor SigK [Bacilli bacterium]|jgi:RNA polymerase sporulation-specific sigma factor|nr:RNA polymerase sporulation sigma factor SigK [Bacilli bacterium]
MLNLLSFLLLPLIGAINSESFPEVLSKEEEDKLIQKLKEKDITARNLLIEHNLRLVAHIVKKFENTKENKDDLLSIGAFGLIKAVDSYNPDNNVKLATYASRCIENEILMHLRSNKKYKDTSSLYAPIGEDKEGNEIRLCDIIEDDSPLMIDKLLNEEKNQSLEQALSILNKRELEIISRRFGLGNYFVETQKEIAKSLKISRSYVSRIEKRALSKLYLYLQKET